MRYAILSDIHGNLPALEQVLVECEREGVDAYLCNGDVVGYGAEPNECCEVLRALKAVVVRGNHDEAAVAPGKEEWFTAGARACIVWTREQLTAENREFLSSLPPVLRVEGAHLCHGSLPEPDLYTTTPNDALKSFQLMEEAVCFIGHTHYAEWFIFRPDGRVPTHHPRPEGGDCIFGSGRQYLVNAGSIGQPRDNNSQASFAIWDTGLPGMTIYRVSYNISATQQRILSAGLPRNMADRLKYGI